MVGTMSDDLKAMDEMLTLLRKHRVKSASADPRHPGLVSVEFDVSAFAVAEVAAEPARAKSHNPFFTDATQE